MVSQASSCGSCAFFDTHHANGGTSSQDGGLCRFNPPVSQPTPEAHGLWPVVSETEWCGHFAPDSVSPAVAAE